MGERDDAAAVIAADRGHRDELTLDEFDTVAFTQNAHPAHPVILGHRDRALRYPRLGGQEARFVEHGDLPGFGREENAPVAKWGNEPMCGRAARDEARQVPRDVSYPQPRLENSTALQSIFHWHPKRHPRGFIPTA